MTDPTGLLQYGALGLLALFVSGFLWIQHDRDVKNEERIARSDAARAVTESAMWALVNATIEARTAETKAFADLAASSAAAQADIVEVLKDLKVGIEEHDVRALDRHHQICAELRSLKS